jgi:multiple sugar transport system permease protein
MSLFNYQLAIPGSDKEFIGFENYKKLYQDSKFYKSIRTTLVYVFSAVFVEMILGVLIALALNRIRFMRKIFTSALLVPMMIAPLVIGLIFSFFTNPQFGLYAYIVNSLQLPLPTVLTDDSEIALTVLIIMDIWEWTPYMALVFLAGLQSISGEYYEAAEVDGANKWQIFWKVTAPLLKPVITVSVLLRAMEALKEFDKPYIFTGGGPGNATEVIDLYTYRQAFTSFKFSYASALCVVLFIVLVTLGMLYEKFVMKENS